jgi:alpha,alpha-trehalase
MHREHMNNPSFRPDSATADQLDELFAYIRQSWRTLSRSNSDLANSAKDPKFMTTEGRPIVYISQTEDRQRVEKLLLERMNTKDLAQVDLRILPDDPTAISEHGLLYLPHPYVVPGGRFNEMYGWDSYFILLGLIRDGETAAAKDMTDNLLYEVEYYGKVLNANRSYYLTRSQPPFISHMVREIYQITRDKIWLRKAISLIEKTYDMWTDEQHLCGGTGLSRYYTGDPTPAPEVIADERDDRGYTHFDRVREFYRSNQIRDYDVSQYYDAENDALTSEFYIGDRTMRESGFDPSNRFGPFNVDVANYAPVCLNSLLAMLETDMAFFSAELGDPTGQIKWQHRVGYRAAGVNDLLWDKHEGLFFDLNFKTGLKRRYPFLTSFYPLWAGIADENQAARIVENLGIFERPGGLQTSPFRTGSQWDAPFGWASLQLIAIEGLRKYGFEREANRVAVNFLSMILKEFIKTGTIVEKYDVERRDAETAGAIQFGYDYNVVGFGWTNAVFLRLYDGLPEATRPDVLRIGGTGVSSEK